MRALITIIGTGPGKRTIGIPEERYRMARYQLPDPDQPISEPVPFCFFPLAEWLKPDEIHVLGTRESMWPAILDFLSRRYGMDDDERETLWEEAVDALETEKMDGFIRVLEERVNRLVSGYRYRFHLHGYLEDGDAQWTFFHNLSTIAREADTVYLDFTHGFRHIPLFVFTAITYIQSLFKRPRLAGIYYGALEMKSNPRDQDEPARIIDLTAAWDMTRWFHATRDFQIFGNSADLSQQLSADAPVVSRRLQSVDLSLKMNCAAGLDRKVRNLNKALENLPEDRRRPWADLKATIRNSFRSLDEPGSEWKKQVRLAFWYFNHRLYMQALTVLKEAFVSRYLEATDQDIYDIQKRLMKDDNQNNAFERQLKKEGRWQLYKDIREIRNILDHSFLGDDHDGSIVKTKEDEIRRIFSRDSLKALLGEKV